METEYKLQQSSNASTVDGMDKRMIELRTNIDQLQQVKQKLDQDKSQLRKANEQLQSQVCLNRLQKLDWQDNADYLGSRFDQ